MNDAATCSGEYLIGEVNMIHDVDIKEIDLNKRYPGAFRRLLRDHSRFNTFKEQHPELNEEQLSEHVDDPKNLIIWATDDYGFRGDGYGFHDPITVAKVTGENGMLIRPRCEKTASEQSQRVRDKAEVFTPSWVCNVQNNLVDESWFERKEVFNREKESDDVGHYWETNSEPITVFPEGKTWRDYVCDKRLEVTCGEAPYLVSRYDATTGEYIDVKHRIGLLDRKLRIVSENCDKSSEWIKMAKVAYKSTYGFEWQGDNLLLAREALLYTFIEYYHEKFGKLPQPQSVDNIAYIISWNIWQMDGLKFVIPGTCHEWENEIKTEPSLFEEEIVEKRICPCPGCFSGDNKTHNGIYAIIRNWDVHADRHKDEKGKIGKERCDIRFVNLVNVNSK